MPADRRLIRPWTQRRLLVVVTVLSTLLVGACTAAPPHPATVGAAGTTLRIATYTAVGDSYTAAPFVPTTSLARGCLRSDHDYPRLLARALGAHLRDVSCSGATTADLRRPQLLGYGALRSRLRPQLDAVRRDTDLVTVGLGGNDADLFATLVRHCLGGRPVTGSCWDGLTGQLGDPETVLAGTGRRVAAALRAVHRAAPDARVVLVGYPRIVDPDRSCRALPLSPTDRRLLAAVERRLDRALAAAAHRTATTFLDLRTRSRGHEVCSSQPWVNGPVTDQQRAAAFHPFAVEQRAVADALLGLLDG